MCRGSYSDAADAGVMNLQPRLAQIPLTMAPLIFLGAFACGQPVSPPQASGGFQVWLRRCEHMRNAHLLATVSRAGLCCVTRQPTFLSHSRFLPPR